jgi:hypothetical protein
MTKRWPEKNTLQTKFAFEKNENSPMQFWSKVVCMFIDIVQLVSCQI